MGDVADAADAAIPRAEVEEAELYHPHSWLTRSTSAFVIKRAPVDEILSAVRHAAVFTDGEDIE